MSEVALDTNILLRLANPGAPEHALCRAAVTQLADSGEKLAVAPQVLIEFGLSPRVPSG